MSLLALQLDIAARLRSADAFADVPVFTLRPRASQTAAQIQDRINAALGAISMRNGKVGLCLTVLMPSVTTQRPELPGPYIHIRCKVRVEENVFVNMGPGGTQTPCEDAAIATAQTLHLWTPGGTSGVLHVSEETIKPATAPEGRIAYEVGIESELDLACPPRSTAPAIMLANGMISIQAAQSAAVIYYSTDGSSPVPGATGSGGIYTAPFPPGASRVIRAAAYVAGSLGSDIVALEP